MNIREGPACRVSGSPPENANTAGIIINPAMIAIAVSKISTFLCRIFNGNILFHIGTKGDQNTHGNGQRIEHLSHSRYNRHP